MIRKIFQPIFDFILFSNLFMALCAVAQGLVTFYLIGVRPLPQILWLLFTSTMLVYNFGLLITKPVNSNPPAYKRAHWFCAHHRLVTTITIVSFLSLIPLFFQLSLASKILLVFLCILSLTYSIPMFNKGSEKFGIRNIPGLKQLLITFVWTISCVLIPVLEANDLKLANISIADASILITERFLFFGALTIPFDIRDLPDDKIKGVKTIPVIWGEKNAYLICGILLACYFCSLLVFSDNGLNTNFLALTVTVILAGWLIFKSNFSKNEYYYSFLVDGVLILQYLLLILFEIFTSNSSFLKIGA